MAKKIYLEIGKNHWSKTDSESSPCKTYQDSNNRKQYKAIKNNSQQWTGLKAQSMQVATSNWTRRNYICLARTNKDLQWDKQSEIAGKWSWL